MFSHVDLCEFSILFYDVYRPGSIGLRLYSTFKKGSKVSEVSSNWSGILVEQTAVLAEFH